MEADDLIARLEAAAGPCRRLDARILMLLEGGSEADAEYAASAPERTCAPPRYTDSLDAARLAVPPDHLLTIYCEPDGTGGATVQRDADRLVSMWPRHPGRGATPAIAVVIAGLRAREAADA